ncbi:MAG: DJ-1/PfpI family protein [Pseudomonadota bacterium]|nr:DJ-1/PfpI family protein [Gammaproteobacteria bacterium]MDQ3581015.1 DJ-1/PfpI family protein [Pseudomonadota bacterium]
MTAVLVPLAEGCEELEAVTVIDLLRRAGIEVVSAGLEAGPVVASRGVRLLPDTTLDEALQRDYDMVVLPGGAKGAGRLEADARVSALLTRMAEEGRYTAAICAAPRVLATAGLLRGKRATAYPGILQAMALAHVTVRDTALERDGKVITSRGPGTAMDFALCLIELLEGQQKRDEVEAQLARTPPP